LSAPPALDADGRGGLTLGGVLESLAAATLGRSCTVVETACAAMGAPVCRFVAS